MNVIATSMLAWMKLTLESHHQPYKAPWVDKDLDFDLLNMKKEKKFFQVNQDD